MPSASPSSYISKLSRRFAVFSSVEISFYNLWTVRSRLETSMIHRQKIDAELSFGDTAFLTYMKFHANEVFWNAPFETLMLLVEYMQNARSSATSNVNGKAFFVFQHVCSEQRYVLIAWLSRLVLVSIMAQIFFKSTCSSRCFSAFVTPQTHALVIWSVIRWSWPMRNMFFLRTVLVNK